MKYLIPIILIIILAYFYCQPFKRDYTGLTIYEKPYPDIAIDIEQEYNGDYIRLLWKISKGAYTK